MCYINLYYITLHYTDSHNFCFNGHSSNCQRLKLCPLKVYLANHRDCRSGIFYRTDGQLPFLTSKQQYQHSTSKGAIINSWQKRIILKKWHKANVFYSFWSNKWLRQPAVLSWHTGQFADQMSAPSSHPLSTSLVCFLSLPSVCWQFESVTSYTLSYAKNANSQYSQLCAQNYRWTDSWFGQLIQLSETGQTSTVLRNSAPAEHHVSCQIRCDKLFT